MLTKFVPPFRTGDVVEYVGNSSVRNLGNTIHIINAYDVILDKYSTNRGAWYKHTDFKLIEECSANSIEKLRKDIYYEEDYDEDEKDYREE